MEFCLWDLGVFLYIDIQGYLPTMALWMWLNYILPTPRENTKEKDKTEVAPEETEEREQAAPRGRKTANSQGRRKGRITRSMTNEAAQANAAAAAATEEPPPPLPPPPESCE